MNKIWNSPKCSWSLNMILLRVKQWRTVLECFVAKITFVQDLALLLYFGHNTLWGKRNIGRKLYGLLELLESCRDPEIFMKILEKLLLKLKSESLLFEGFWILHVEISFAKMIFLPCCYGYNFSPYWLLVTFLIILRLLIFIHLSLFSLLRSWL